MTTAGRRTYIAILGLFVIKLAAPSSRSRTRDGRGLGAGAGGVLLFLCKDRVSPAVNPASKGVFSFDFRGGRPMVLATGPRIPPKKCCPALAGRRKKCAHDTLEPRGKKKKSATYPTASSEA